MHTIGASSRRITWMATMSGTPDAIMRQWFREVWDEGREDAIDRLIAPDAKVHGLSEGTIEGWNSFDS